MSKNSIPVRKEFNSRDEAFAYLRKFTDEFKSLVAKHFEGGNFVNLDLSLIWDVHVKGDPEELNTILTTQVKPKSLEGVRDIVHNITFKDPLYIDAVLEKLKNTFVNVILSENMAIDALIKRQVDDHNSEKEEEIPSDSTTNNDNSVN